MAYPKFGVSRPNSLPTLDELDAERKRMTQRFIAARSQQMLSDHTGGGTTEEEPRGFLPPDTAEEHQWDRVVRESREAGAYQGRTGRRQAWRSKDGNTGGGYNWQYLHPGETRGGAREPTTAEKSRNDADTAERKRQLEASAPARMAAKNRLWEQERAKRPARVERPRPADRRPFNPGGKLPDW